MRKIIAFIFLGLALFVSTIYIINDPTQGGAFLARANTLNYEAELKQDLLCLILAYPENIDDIVKEDDRVYLTLKSGQRLLYDDRKVKSLEGKMANPDIQDMLEQPYPLAMINKLMEKDYDPGRVRMYALLKSVYGSNQQQIEKQLGNVRVGGKSFQFSKSNGASDALKAAMSELILLAQSNSKVSAAAFPSSGTYNYRLIAGTNRLSPHAFGIAIDLARDKRDYWQWASREEGQKRLEQYPKEIVEVFEKHNFVWGGKWGHFDILHFEYRPEIILKARYFGEERMPGETWYSGAPEDPDTRAAIQRIEEAIK